MPKNYKSQETSSQLCHQTLLYTLTLCQNSNERSLRYVGYFTSSRKCKYHAPKAFVTICLIFRCPLGFWGARRRWWQVRVHRNRWRGLQKRRAQVWLIINTWSHEGSILVGLVFRPACTSSCTPGRLQFSSYHAVT